MASASIALIVWCIRSWSSFRFIGQPSKEKAFHAQRKEREVEWANAVAAETAAAGAKAQKVNLSVNCLAASYSFLRLIARSGGIGPIALVWL